MAGGYHTGLVQIGTFPSLKKVILDSTAPEERHLELY